jgi:protoheme IX farnesyltransferase
MAAPLLQTAKNYFLLTKPNVWWLLAFTGVAGIVAASGGIPEIQIFVLAMTSIITGVAGTEAVSNYIERDLDAAMKRTSKRVIPKGLIKPAWKALVFGLGLIAVSLAVAALINPVTFLFMATGMVDYLVIYVMWSKRRTPLNIILGSYAGGAPLMAGYTAVSYWPTPEAWIMASLIVLWIPPHIWSLALIYREDYRNAHVPMLPVVTSEATAIRCIASTTVLSVLFSFLLYFLHPDKYGLVYLVAAGLSGAAIGLTAFALMLSPNRSTAYRLFKLTSPQLFILMLAIIIDNII